MIQDISINRDTEGVVFFKGRVLPHLQFSQNVNFLRSYYHFWKVWRNAKKLWVWLFHFRRIYIFAQSTFVPYRRNLHEWRVIQLLFYVYAHVRKNISTVVYLIQMYVQFVHTCVNHHASWAANVVLFFQYPAISAKTFRTGNVANIIDWPWWPEPANKNLYRI